MMRRLRQLLRSARQLVEWALAWPVLFFVGLLTEHGLRAFAGVVGRIAYHLLAGERRRMLRNLELVFGDNMTAESRRRLALAVFRHHVLTFAEILRLTPAWVAAHVRIKGADIARRALQQSGRGVVVISGHLGNFEILGAAAAHCGFPSTMLARPLDNPFLERILVGRRARYGSRTAVRTAGGVRQMLRRLRAGEFIALAVDLNATQGGVFINAWGIPASTPPGPALIALRYDVPVHLMTVHRRPDGDHEVNFFPAFTLIRTGDHAADVRANLQQFTDAFQAEVLRRPDQYYWQYPRWRTRPNGVTLPRNMEFEPSLAAERVGPPFPAPPGW